MDTQFTNDKRSGSRTRMQIMSRKEEENNYQFSILNSQLT